jgi:gamma-glutamylcyclotransferase (GGCT)/AIG2-like uncharacterized protein YtfP
MEHIFSYGTLQLETVQLSTFGRTLEGRPDLLPGYRTTLLKITDPAVVKTSGRTHHPIVSFSGDARDRVAGTVFRVTHDELLQADAYEVSDYRRVRVTLASGTEAWVYAETPTGDSAA